MVSVQAEERGVRQRSQHRRHRARGGRRDLGELATTPADEAQQSTINGPPRSSFR